MRRFGLFELRYVWIAPNGKLEAPKMFYVFEIFEFFLSGSILFVKSYFLCQDFVYIWPRYAWKITLTV